MVNKMDAGILVIMILILWIITHSYMLYVYHKSDKSYRSSLLVQYLSFFHLA